MKNKHLFVLVFILALLVACGNSSQEISTEPVVDQVQTEVEEVEEAPEEEEADGAVEEEAEEVMEEESASEEAAEGEVEETIEEETESEEVMEEETAVGFGNIPMSGIDEDTGLEINPPSYGPGDTFIVRGTVISMNLTPITSPEFLIESPEGVRYRVKTQPLDETFFIDGFQWQPFEFRQGVGAMVTIEFDPSLTTSDIPSGNDLILVMQE